MGNASGTGSITEYGGGSGVKYHTPLWVFSNGIFQGYGTVIPTLSPGTNHYYVSLYNYGKIIADGFGTDRELSFPNYTNYTNFTYLGTNYSGVVGQTNTSDKGWYARNNGKLTLAPLPVTLGTNAVTWGDTYSNSDLTMVNSLRASFSSLTATGTFSASLLATNRTDIGSPAVLFSKSEGRVLGIWNLSCSSSLSNNFSSVALTFRYDPTRLAGRAYQPRNIVVLRYNGTNDWCSVTSALADTNRCLAYGQSTNLAPMAVIMMTGGTVLSWR
jgi:hypothetical protein